MCYSNRHSIENLPSIELLRISSVSSMSPMAFSVAVEGTVGRNSVSAGAVRVVSVVTGAFSLFVP